MMGTFLSPEREIGRILLILCLCGAICTKFAVAGDPTSTTDSAHWAWRPVTPAAPPEVLHRNWPRGAIDQFILARLETAKLAPAGECDRATLIRRASFVLTGLPPSFEEVAAFETDHAPGAFEKAVDRLLASPRFGEHWARHWMDLVRYSETLGNEADAPIPNAWRYRDYLIRGFNADVPYNQFVVEHLAGDLLPAPRRNAVDGSNESIIATGFFWMNEGKRSPVDVKLAEADCFDNKLDVACKTFVGLTVACARCHDHKFDPISTVDYYGLYGYLKSSRYTQAELNRTELDAKAARLITLRDEIRQTAANAMAIRAGRIARYLEASIRVGSAPADIVAGDEGLSGNRLAKWSSALRQDVTPTHPMYPWNLLVSVGSQRSTDELKKQWSEARARMMTSREAAARSLHRSGDIDIAHFDDGASGAKGAVGFAGWSAEDQSFGAAPSLPGDVVLGVSPEHPIQGLFRGGPWAHSGVLSRRLEGTLRSPTFVLQRRYLHVLCAGIGSRINVNIDHFVMIQDPLYGGLRRFPNSEGRTWVTFDLGLWKDHEAYLECCDTTTQDLHDQGSPTGAAKNAFVALSRAMLSDNAAPPTILQTPAGAALATGEPIDSLHALAEQYQRVTVESLQALAHNRLRNMPDAEARAELVSWMIDNRLLDAGDDASAADVSDDAGAPAKLTELFAAFAAEEASIPEPIRCPATIDGTAEDEHVFIRGSHNQLGPIANRRMPLTMFAATQSPAPVDHSGRLELARRMVDPSANPFVSRVIVNRLWHQVFGRGIVASVDNFGAMGSAPTHPELLDYLAARFVREDGWSIKTMLREMVLSRTFAMSSSPTPADEADPDDQLLHRMRIRRLEGEAIRDEMLSVAGTLDAKMFGPSVEIYVTPEQSSYIGAYGKPAVSGPLDGAGRRSVYQAVRRNFLSPLMLAFDVPPPLNTAGRRNVSNVPAQALILMNDPFVAQEAAAWARQTLAIAPIDTAQRVARMYQQAFSRAPTADEIEEARAFLHDHASELGVGSDDPRLWADFAHVLFNVKEFVFIN